MARKRKEPKLLVFGKMKRKQFRPKKRKAKAPISILGGAKLLGKGVAKARLLKARHFPKLKGSIY